MKKDIIEVIKRIGQPMWVIPGHMLEPDEPVSEELTPVDIQWWKNQRAEWEADSEWMINAPNYGRLCDEAIQNRQDWLEKTKPASECEHDMRRKCVWCFRCNKMTYIGREIKGTTSECEHVYDGPVNQCIKCDKPQPGTYAPKPQPERVEEIREKYAKHPNDLPDTRFLLATIDSLQSQLETAKQVAREACESEAKLQSQNKIMREALEGIEKLNLYITDSVGEPSTEVQLLMQRDFTIHKLKEIAKQALDSVKEEV